MAHSCLQLVRYRMMLHIMCVFLQRLFSHRETPISHSGSRYGSSSLYQDADRSLDVGKYFTETVREQEACTDHETLVTREDNQQFVFTQSLHLFTNSISGDVTKFYHCDLRFQRVWWCRFESSKPWYRVDWYIVTAVYQEFAYSIYMV